jgi:hypothetical protein
MGDERVMFPILARKASTKQGHPWTPFSMWLGGWDFHLMTSSFPLRRISNNHRSVAMMAPSCRNGGDLHCSDSIHE